MVFTCQGTTLFSKDLRPASPDTVLLTIKTPPPVPYLKDPLKEPLHPLQLC